MTALEPQQEEAVAPGSDWDIETTAEAIARKHSQYKGGRVHADWYYPAKAAALEALQCAQQHVAAHPTPVQQVLEGQTVKK